MARRNTLTVDEVVDEGNRILRESTCTPPERMAVASFIEHLLLKTDQYSGFGYLTQTEVPAGQLPGIIPGYTNGERDNTKNTYPDESRRSYGMKRRKRSKTTK